jgi:hypothetical protein
VIDVADRDIAPGRLRLTEPELADVRPALADPSIPAFARELLEVVADPQLRIMVRIFTAAAPLVHQVWATPRVAVVGAPAEPGRVELAALEPVMIPFALAHAVGLRRRPAPPDRQPIRVPVAAYRAGQGGGPVPPELTAIVRRRRMSWRAMSAWRTTTGEPVTRTLHVTDAGPAGLWRLRVEDPNLLIEPTTARDVWRALAELLPGKR